MSQEMPLATVVVSSNAYPGPAQVICGFVPTGYVIVTDSSNSIYFSFDGATTHGVLHPNLTNPVSYPTAKQSIWFKNTAANQTSEVHVMGTGT